MQRAIISIIALCAAIWTTAQISYTPPVKLTFDSQESFDQWTTINVNQNVGFEFSAENGAEIAQDKTAAMDNRLISPAIELEEGITYTLKLYCMRISTFSSDKAAFSITAGTEATAEGQSKVLYSESSFQSSLFKEVTTRFTPTASGTYYLGLHMTTKSYNGGFAVQYLDIQPVLPLPGAVTGLAVAAAPEGAQEALLSWIWPEKTNLGGTLAQIGGAYIYRGTSSYFTANDASLVGTYTTDATPGTEAVWTDTSVPEPGKYYYRVVPFNDNGTSPASTTAVQSPWLGKDTGVSGVSGVTATVSPESETTVLLTFNPPTGSNGGYIDLADIAYKITRTSGSGTTATLEEAWRGELPYVDATLPGLDSYTYSVYSVYNGSTSWSAAKSNAVVTGGTVPLPYSQDFSASSSTALFTFFHGEGASRDWSRSSNALNYWGSPADAWAVLPKFHLEAGKAYELTFTARVNRAASPKELYVYTGTEASAEGLPTEVFHETVSSTFAETKSLIISVDADGEYCIAFRCYGPSDSNDIYVDDITVAETVITPQPVSELTAEVAPKGELAVTLRWLNPSRTTTDSEITVLDKVEVLTGNDSYTVDAPEAGAESSITVPVESAGTHTFTVVPYLNGYAGAASEITSAWAGPDTPLAPADVAVEARGTERIITFSPVTEGVNGGYIDTEAMRYSVSRNGETLADDLHEPIFTDTDADLPLAMYTYTVSAHCAGLESDPAQSEAIQLGDALTLPYKPDFTDAASFDLWTFSKTAGGLNTWSYNSSNQAISTSSESAWAYTPPFTAQEGTAKVSFQATYTMGSHIEPISVYLCTENAPEAKAAPVQLTEFTPTGVDYPSTQEHVFNVPATGKYYIGYLSSPDNWGIRLHQSDIEQLTVTTGVDTVSAARGIAVNPDGTFTADSAGTLTLYSLSGAPVWSAATTGGTLRPDVQPGLYIAVWYGTDASVNSFKYLR